jgi:hypothetical protein
MNAIGRGQMPVGPLSLPSFVFNDSDLAANLLGVGPFSNMTARLPLRQPRSRLVTNPVPQFYLATGNHPSAYGW